MSKILYNKWVFNFTTKTQTQTHKTDSFPRVCVCVCFVFVCMYLCVCSDKWGSNWTPVTENKNPRDYLSCSTKIVIVHRLNFAEYVLKKRKLFIITLYVFSLRTHFYRLYKTKESVSSAGRIDFFNFLEYNLPCTLCVISGIQQQQNCNNI